MLEFLDFGGWFQKQVFFEDQIDSTLILILNSQFKTVTVLYCTSAIGLSTKLGFELKIPLAFCLLPFAFAIYIYIHIYTFRKQKKGGD